jgi:hypothetical protein
LIVKISKRRNYHTFIRVLSSQVASHVMKRNKFEVFRKSLSSSSSGDACKYYTKAMSETQGLGQAFWQFRPFSRVLDWGRDFKGCCNYVLKNKLEAIGFFSYYDRKTSVLRFRLDQTDD